MKICLLCAHKTDEPTCPKCGEASFSESTAPAPRKSKTKVKVKPKGKPKSKPRGDD